jgi:hypothetical protein
MRPFEPHNDEQPLSIRIGRIVVRLVLLVLVVWGAIVGYQAYRRSQRAKEIAPIHAYALDIMVALKKSDFFAVQEHLDPSMHRTVSIDWIAYFAEYAELNATRTGTWGDWNATHETNATLYHLQGTLYYTNDHTSPMTWEIKKSGDTLHVEDLRIGKRALRPKKRSGL